MIADTASDPVGAMEFHLAVLDATRRAMAALENPCGCPRPLPVSHPDACDVP